MPALWQSSQRPMYVRTVWVDGFRHAILTRDDPQFLKLCARRRPKSSSSYLAKVTRTRSSLRDDVDVGELHFVIKSNNADKEKQLGHREDIETLNLADIESCTDEFEENTSQRAHDLNTAEREINWEIMKPTKSKTARHEYKENTELSDRVLQWLDVAGKIDLLAPNNNEIISQPRHSWPDIQRRNLIKSKTAMDLRPKEIKQTYDTKTSGYIDRAEFYLPTTANTIENYAKQSRNARGTQRHHVKNDDKKVNAARTNTIRTNQKIATEKNAIEEKYSDLMNKKHNSELAKSRKQVHIFMPEAITKKFGSNSTSKTGSLISQTQ